ncbi:MAG: hypothetical protein IT477_07370 [Rhodanobacteraceae bacterium]|nr:hypothetical protein [Rhodanobacteraceae bacterium]MDL1867879.1 hypothetical protein [Gammaproteobacteria bacterium PRO6]
MRDRDRTGDVIAKVRGLLLHATIPGATVHISMPFRAPAKHDKYTLYFGFVAEGQAWCDWLASMPAIVLLSVHP